MTGTPGGWGTPAAGQCDEEVRRLGRALGERVEEVLQRATERVESVSKVKLDASVDECFQRIGRGNTAALASWLAGGDPRDGQASTRRAWHTYGQLAAQSAAPLNEVTKRCLCWRDAVVDVLSARGVEHGVSPAALWQAIAMTQRSIDVTLVRMCETFERERVHIAQELTRREDELAFVATHDQLTGLPNRTLILDRGEQMLGRARRQRKPIAALLIDLDGFTAVNDTLGRAAGDELLRAIAGRFDGLVRDIDALGRIGGDEFVLLVEEFGEDADAQLIAERLREALRAPFTLAGGASSPHPPTGTMRPGTGKGEDTELTLTASIGVATGVRAAVEELLRDADIAMHRAKLEGKNRCVMFERGMHDVVQSRMALEMDLRRALAHDEFFLLYQPTFDLRCMIPTGVEALIRWRSAVRGIVQPNDFIPLLEETGLIVEVGRWALLEACCQGADWRDAGHPVGVAVNVSARQLETDQFVEDVHRAISLSDLPAQALTLEITETALMRNPEHTARRLHAIKELGVRIAIDDFGTGYSSLAHLQRFPVDSLKIDRSFISQLRENPEGETLLRTLVQLGKALSIETLAEGIELPNQLSLLQEERCDSGQGFLFARPLEAGATETFLQSFSDGGVDAPASNSRRPSAGYELSRNGG